MEALTHHTITDNLSMSPPHGVIGFDSSEIYGTQPPMRFFYVHRSASLCGIERGSLRACRLRIAGLSTLFSLTPMFDSIRRGLKNLHIRASKMKISLVQIGQSHPKTVKCTLVNAFHNCQWTARFKELKDTAGQTQQPAKHRT